MKDKIKKEMSKCMLDALEVYLRYNLINPVSECCDEPIQATKLLFSLVESLRKECKIYIDERIAESIESVEKAFTEKKDIE